MAPRWSRSSAEGGSREDGAEEGNRCHPEGEDGSPPPQASAWSWASTGVEEQGGLMAKVEEAWTQLATRIPKDLHYRLKLHCVMHDIALMYFVTEAVKEKLGRKVRPKKGTS